MANPSMFGVALMNAPLEVVRVLEITASGEKIVMVRCFCTKFFATFERNIKSGESTSCGCLKEVKK